MRGATGGVTALAICPARSDVSLRSALSVMRATLNHRNQSMARTAEMFEKPKVPRRVMMHVMDAGHGDTIESMVRWSCSKCGHETDWSAVGESISTLKRGVPCPKCNADQPGEKQ